MPSSGPVERAATRRVPLRALFAGVICLALVASVWTVLDLSRDAHRRADERTHTQRLRVDLVRLQAVGWHGLAEGAPDFTIATEAKTLGARVRREARALPELPGGPSERVRVIRLVDELLRGIDAEMVDLNGAANAAARRELTTTLLGSTDLLDAALDAAERHAGRQAASAGSRLLRGTLIAIGAVGLLLAAGFLIVRRVRRAMEDALRHQAFHDVLTGLPNRALFDDRLTRALARARRGETEVAVVLVDLDDFKAVNDSLGHAAGDELLVECARRFDAIVRATDTAARLGGDEFAVLVADRDAAAAAADVARRLREALDAPFPVQGRALHVGASLGVALAEPGADPLDVVRNADIAMYAAKDRGGDELVAFRPEMLHAARERLDLREDLRHALERGELCVHYQPVVSLADGQMMAVEALLRWTHPVHGEVSPVRFIPVAEETGMIVALGAWVLAQACRDLPTLQRAAPDVRVGVNVSAVQLREPGFVEDVRRILEQTGVAPEHIVLELTESVFADDASVADALKALGALGVALSVDDFGTGYSSLSYLRRLDVDSVKIDRSFVAGLGEEPRDAALVRSIIELGHALGLTMVAEGVEEPDQEHFLRDAGCDLAQGWLFGRPAPLSRHTSQAPSPAPS